MTRPVEYDAEVTVCGDVVFLRRSMALMRRLEQRFGPLPTLFRSLNAADVTQQMLTGIYEELVRGMDGAPSVPTIAAWVWEEGSYRCATDLARLIGELTVGARQLRAYEDKRMAEAEEAGQNPTRPASPATPETTTAASPSAA